LKSFRHASRALVADEINDFIGAEIVALPLVATVADRAEVLVRLHKDLFPLVIEITALGDVAEVINRVDLPSKHPPSGASLLDFIGVFDLCSVLFA